MSRGFSAFSTTKQKSPETNKFKDDRTGKMTVHPELLDQQGRITDEELLTVRFSRDTDPPQSAETSAE